MSGQKINDHASWVGGRSKGSVFPEGVKTKDFSSAEGAGSLGMYEDTTEAIKKAQEYNKGKIKANATKAMHRN